MHADRIELVERTPAGRWVRGAVVAAVVGALVLAPRPFGAVVAAPPNDSFSSPLALTGPEGTVTGSNVGATKQAGEPFHAGNAGGASVWYTLPGIAPGRMTLSTAGSTFDTVLAVYTGSTLVNLRPIAANDEGGPGGTSRLSFDVVAGTTYLVAVDGFGGATGSIVLGWDHQPPNDDFGAATLLNPSPLTENDTMVGSSLGASSEPGEPAHAGVAGGRSVWYRLNAPARGTMTIDTDGSSFDTALAVYTGATLGTLTAVASNDDDPDGGTRSRVRYTAVRGQAYWIAVTGKAGASGEVVLNWEYSQPNDDFASAAVLSTLTGSRQGSNFGATAEPIEPPHAGSFGGRSVWYRWTAPIGGAATFSTAGSTFDTVLAVYTGGSLGSLVELSSNDDAAPGLVTSSVTFGATAGSVYQVVVDSKNVLARGDIELSWAGGGRVPPTAAFTATPNPAACSQTVTFDASGSVAGSGGVIASYTWEFGDGAVGSGRIVTHAFGAFGAYTVTLTAGDGGTPPAYGTATGTVEVSLGNRAPVPAPGGPYASTLGTPVVLDARASSDPDAACGDSIVAYEWDLDRDGSFGDLDGPTPTVTATQLAALGPGVHPLSLRVRDSFGVAGVGVTTLRITTGAVPVVAAGPDVSIAEGARLLRTGTFTDGESTAWTATVDYGDTTGQRPLAVDGTTKSFVLDHVYADNGARTVTVCVTASGGATGCDSVAVTVTNAAPSVGTGGALAADEGATLQLSVPFTDPGTRDTHTATVDWGDGSPLDDATVTESPFGPPGSTLGLSGTATGGHVYADDGVFLARVCVLDDDGATGCGSRTVTIRNVAPTVGAIAVPAGTILPGTAVGLWATFSDPGLLDTHTGTWSWGDGTTTPATVGSGIVTGSHAYVNPGTYSVTLTVTDGDGGTGTASRVLVISAGNLLANGSFENGTLAGWTLRSATGAVVSGGVDGLHAARIAAAGAATPYSLALASPVPAAGVGSVYQAEAWIRADRQERRICLNLRVYDAAGAQVAMPQRCSSSRTTWRRINPVSYTVTTAGVRIELELQAVNAVAGDSFEVDGIVLTGPALPDTAPPDTFIVSGPPPYAAARTASFTLAATEPGSRFECRYDGGAWAACPATVELTGLSEGPHTFEARGIDPSNNTDATPASWSWLVDLTTPSVEIAVPAAAAAYNAARLERGCGLCGSAEDVGGSGLERVEVTVQQLATGRYWNPVSRLFDSPFPLPVTATGTGSWSVPFAPGDLQADGVYAVEARAVDRAGNAGARTSVFTYDTAPPDTTVASGPPAFSGSATATFEITATEPGGTFECRWDGGAWNSCGATVVVSALGEGAHAFEARASDPAGNVDPTPAAWSWTVDLTAPAAAISFPAAGSAYNAAGIDGGCGVCGTATDGGGAGVLRVEVSVRRMATGLYWSPVTGAFDSVGEARSTASGTASWTLAFPPARLPADGDYLVTVRAVDLAGNASVPTAGVFTYDNMAPETTIDAGPIGSVTATTATFSFSSSEPGSTATCTLDGGPATPCSTPVTYTGLAMGAHTFSVRAVDRAGNPDPTPASRSWTIVSGQQPPPQTGNLLTNGSFEEGTTAGWAFGNATGSVVAPGRIGSKAVRVTRTSGSRYALTLTQVVDGGPAGTVFTADAWQRAVREVNGICLLLLEKSSSGAVRQTRERCRSAKKEWKRFDVWTLTTTADGSTVVLEVAQTSASPGDWFEVDGITLTRG